jgi:beta-phosphoglucomutase-like phosphatase (HAD superfamily)
LIARLGEAGVPIALASNSHRILVDRALATAGIDPGVFVAILTADVVSRPKPAPDIYVAACQALGTRPHDTLALEDSPTGVAAAVAAGCYTIAVPSLDGVALDAADLVVESLADPAITRALGL